MTQAYLMSRTSAGRRAFIVTLDALLAVVLAGLMASSAILLLRESQNLDWKEVYLQRVMDDILATIDESGLVTSTVSETQVQDALGLLPDGICVRLQFMEKGATGAYKTIVRSGCGAPSTRKLVARRQMLYFENGALGKWTVALAEGWYK